MESVVRDNQVSSLRPSWRGRRVLVTGHTGFKGAWLCEWLLQEGAIVSGLALPPESDDALSVSLRIPERIDHAIVDIRDAIATTAAIQRLTPEVVFHLAAQSLVRRSYREPLDTWQTNVMGTLNVLEGARSISQPVTVVAVTTDKVYKNREWEHPYREVDELGGHDPYSASKAGCELAVASWRGCFASFDGVTVATARAGNVLGAGDVCEDRIVPDCFRAWRAGRVVDIRHPGSTRPWQHVLDPLSGYLALAEQIAQPRSNTLDTCNFGPATEGHRTVLDVVSSLAARGKHRAWRLVETSGAHEARSLSLSIARAQAVLGWQPRLSFEETVEWTNAGYSAPSHALPDLVARQIHQYVSIERPPGAAS